MPFDLRMVILNRKISEKSKQKKDLDQNKKSPIIADKFIFLISYWSWSSHALFNQAENFRIFFKDKIPFQS